MARCVGAAAGRTVLSVGSATEALPDGVIEHDGMLWKPRRGATASAEAFISARTLFIELNHEAVWNPWIRDERKADIDGAAEIMGQWQRAEPGQQTPEAQAVGGAAGAARTAAGEATCQGRRSP